MKQGYIIRDVRPEEFEATGRLMVEVYSQLAGFPTPLEQPGYYAMLENVGSLTEKPETVLLGAVSPQGAIAGPSDDARAYSEGPQAHILSFSSLRVRGLFRRFVVST